MSNKIQQSIKGGIIATAVMSMVMWLAAMMGMPKMSPPAMLSMMMGLPIIVGWLMHFMIGIIFAMLYSFFFMKVLRKINSNILKGAIFGFAAFLIAQVSLGAMGSIFPMPPMEGSMMLMMLGSIIGHFVFGIVAVQFIKEPVAKKTFA